MYSVAFLIFSPPSLLLRCTPPIQQIPWPKTRSNPQLFFHTLHLIHRTVLRLCFQHLSREHLPLSSPLPLSGYEYDLLPSSLDQLEIHANLTAKIDFNVVLICISLTEVDCLLICLRTVGIPSFVNHRFMSFAPFFFLLGLLDIC